MSTEKTNSKLKKNDMAFVAPLVRKDYPIFMSTPVERKKAKSTPRTSKDSASDVATSQQAEKRKRMEQHKHRRARRYPKKKTQVALRKISEINEEVDEELFFDEMQKGFTRLYPLSRVKECSESEEDPSPVVSPQPLKKKLFGIFVWKPFSFRKKGAHPEDDA